MSPRVRQLSSFLIKRPKSVIYVLSREIRLSHNFALQEAIKEANSSQLPLAVVFVLHKISAPRAREQYEFLLTGLVELEAKLKRLSIPLILLIGDPKERLETAFELYAPKSVYFDMNPISGPKKLRNYFVAKNCLNIYEVDSHNTVPVWAASNKQEIGARTLRPKIKNLLPTFLSDEFEVEAVRRDWPGQVVEIKGFLLKFLIS